MGGYVALLRGINVGGHRKVPMSDLRAVASRMALANARTYVASGNLVFESERSSPALEQELERGIEAHFGFSVDVVVRSREQWTALRAGNPFPEESARQPNLVMVTLGKRSATDADVETLRAKATGEERVERVEGAIWIWFANGAGRSKIATGPSAREVWTTRNWRTVATLAEMLGA